jgi:hypothetical protein
MIIDDRGRLFGKVSIIDLAVILLVVALLGGVYFKLFVYGKDVKEANTSVFQYQVLVSDVRIISVNALKEGDNVFDENTKELLGKIVKKEVMPSEQNILKNDGTYVKAEKPDRYNVIVTVEASGIISANGYLINGKREIKRGLEGKLVTRFIEPKAKVLDIKTISG